VDTFKVNTLGPLVLFQSTQHLLRKASSTGKFVTISSAQGSIAAMIPGKSGAYGVTKAAANFVTLKLQEENPDLIVFPIW
jgi:NAD(P)-dependent dehydrogenase (short-subunit alcohol dehydrogenase family)